MNNESRYLVRDSGGNIHHVSSDLELVVDDSGWVKFIKLNKSSNIQSRTVQECFWRPTYVKVINQSTTDATKVTRLAQSSDQQ